MSLELVTISPDRLRTLEEAARRYADPNYFSAAFKRHTGITPTQYRRKIESRRG